jgi:hypothetical protein
MCRFDVIPAVRCVGKPGRREVGRSAPGRVRHPERIPAGDSTDALADRLDARVRGDTGSMQAY